MCSAISGDERPLGGIVDAVQEVVEGVSGHDDPPSQP